MGFGSDQAFTAFVGIDWADTKHDICVQAAGSSAREFTCIAHEPSQIESWACSLRERFGGLVAVALELSKGPIVYALQKYDFIVLFPINPATLARYRQAFKPSGAKDDPSDAELALDLIERRDGHCRSLAGAQHDAEDGRLDRPIVLLDDRVTRLRQLIRSRLALVGVELQQR
jgi:hypothetical protein